MSNNGVRNGGGALSGEPLETQSPSWGLSPADELSAYRRALEHQVIVAATDRAGHITYVNEKFCETSKYSSAELIGRKHSVVNSGYHPRSFFVSMWKTIASGASWQGEICNRAKDGSIYWVDTTIVPLFDAAGKINGYLSIRYEITARKRADAALHEEVMRRREAETLLLEVIEALPDGVAAYDHDDRLILFNSAYRDFYDRSGGAIQNGVKFETVLRKSFDNGQFQFSSTDPVARQRWFDRKVKEHRSPGRPHLQHLWDGRWLQVQERRSPVGYVVGVRTDITALKQAERQIKDQAERDPLTGLYNRRVLLDRLDRLRTRQRKGDPPVALVLLDLDNFKDINDTLGHGAGDELLRIAADRIRESIRSTDTVARLGGDEFAVILNDVRDDEVVRRLVARLTTRLAQPVRLADRNVNPGATLGVSVYPRDSSDAGELLKFADIALYHAKARGRGSFCFFDAQLRAELQRREAIAAGLRTAIERRTIGIALQPQFALGSQRHEGFEVLARWSNTLNATPSEFIAVAEQGGIIGELGLLVLDKALAAVAQLRRSGYDPGRLAVNVAAAQLKDPGFPRDVAALLHRHGVEASSLEVEVTENVLIDRSAAVLRQALTELHALGVQIALDDFGTGHASLTHLKSMPVDRLKVDRSFVSGVGSNAGDEAIVRTIVTLAHSLGKQVVAEGIETERQLQFLRELRCDTGQGYIVSKPLLEAELEPYLAAQSAPAARRAG